MTIYCLSINSMSLIPISWRILTLLKKRGHRVRLVECCVDGRSKGPELGRDYRPIIRFRTVKAFSSQSPAQKVQKYVALLPELARLRDDDAVYVTDYQVLVVVLAWRKAARRRVRVVYHQVEMLDLERVGRGMRQLVAATRAMVNEGDEFVFPNALRARYFADEWSIASDRVRVLPNTCAKVAAFAPPASQAKVTIGHVGELSESAFYLDAYLSAVRASQLAVHHIFVGIRSDAIAQKIRAALPDAEIIPWLDHEELPQLYSRFDLGLILYRPVDRNTAYCAPNKLYEYWAHGVYALAPDLPGIQCLPSFKEGGAVLHLEDPQRAGLELRTALENRPSRASIRQFFENGECFERLENDVEKLFCPQSSV